MNENCKLIINEIILKIFTMFSLHIERVKKENFYTVTPKTLKYLVGFQRGQSYLTGRRCLFSLGWPPF